MAVRGRIAPLTAKQNCLKMYGYADRDFGTSRTIIIDRDQAADAHRGGGCGIPELQAAYADRLAQKADWPSLLSNRQTDSVLAARPDGVPRQEAEG